MVNPVPISNKLPRSVDVDIVVSLSQTELATDMSLGCIVTDNVDFKPNNDRVRYYSDFDSAIKDTGATTNDTLYWALNAFFSNSEHPNMVAVGRVFNDPVSATLMGGTSVLLNETLKSVVDGSLTLFVDGSKLEMTGMDFSSVSEFDDVLDILNAKTNNKCVFTGSLDNELVCTSSTSGDSSTISFPEISAEGTDVAELLGLTTSTGASKYDGYTPAGLVSECQLIARASENNGHKIFGWCLDSKYRDTSDAQEVAAWVMSDVWHKFGVFCTNLKTAYDTSDTTNIGYVLQQNGNTACATFWHDNPQYFPDVSYMAEALSPDYALNNSTITLKFKDLDGIPTSAVDTTMVSALSNRNINCFTAVGNSARTVRQGTNAKTGIWTDTYVNMCNFIEELSSDVYNVFVRNKKVPFSKDGQNLIVSAITATCQRYVANGSFSDREIEDKQAQDGVGYEPAFKIEPQPLSSVPPAQRAARIGTPVLVTVNESGAMHSLKISVNVVQ